MSEQQLRELVAFASDFCERMFSAKGQIHPMWHAVTSSGEQFIETPMFADKDLAVAMMRALFDLKDVVRDVFIDEAWTVTRLLTEEEYETVQRTGLANFPGRAEIVMIQGEDRDAGQLIAHRDIIRPPKGKPYLGPLQTADDLGLIPHGARVQSGGRMVGLLPVRGARH